ncbi:hypothetical protein RFI_13060 [Reticulomyxa filosa]|uniref:Kelch motif family protein n=1 Tax=Reticulomyxa filosa TaxID=46433 RepID=X6NEC3_RETFI|nr:hypothetical protein RFI_13060 [Reticulomyxa filosa]|eukprot:ETO24099.1 hypothetical protein RFI_13060 [Reticulomyxa filosa]
MNPKDTQSKKEENTELTSPFESLASLPIPLSQSQCVAHKQELLICGGYWNSECYSYHTIKNQYKRICIYPYEIKLRGHCVVKRVNRNDPNDISLLSFGGMKKHALTLRYESIWEEKEKEQEQEQEQAAVGQKSKVNEWIPLTDKKGNCICIGRYQDDYEGARALIGGSNNNLLFITYFPNNIDVFDLDTWQLINQSTFPSINNILFHCFVTTASNGQEHTKSNKMLLFCEHTGLSIDYDEECDIFEIDKVRVCSAIRPFNRYAYVCVGDVILFFGGWSTASVSKETFKYSMKEDKWTKCDCIFPHDLKYSVAVVDADNTYVHIIGGFDGNRDSNMHMRANIETWTKEKTEREKLWTLQEEAITKKEEMQKEIDDIIMIKQKIEKIKPEFDITNLRVEF